MYIQKSAKLFRTPKKVRCNQAGDSAQVITTLLCGEKLLPFEQVPSEIILEFCPYKSGEACFILQLLSANTLLAQGLTCS